MNSVIFSILLIGTLGSGLMAGLFCSFSTFLLQALSELPPPKGIAAMQSINLVIVKPSFLGVFFGTALACALTLGLGWQQLDKGVLVWIAAGGVVYVLGSIMVTIAFNVPLNNRLAAVDPESEEGAQMWQFYLERWIRWNHVRSIASTASTILLLVAVLHANA